MRVFIAFILAFPLYQIIPFGWGWIFLVFLQLLAGFDFELIEREGWK